VTIRERVRTGRVRGYRPSADQLSDLIQLAQKHIEPSTSSAELICNIGEEKLRSDPKLPTVRPEDLRALIEKAGDVRELDNLEFHIKQTTPSRYVEIEIGPGDWTTYTVGSDDDTWTLGRHYELTEKLVSDRTSFAKYKAPRPSIRINEGGLAKWETLPWKPVQGLGVRIAGASSYVPYWINVMVFMVITLTILTYFGDSTEQKHQMVSSVINFINSGNFTISILLAAAYLFLYFGTAKRWNALQLRSKIPIGKSQSIIANFAFRGSRTDQIALASFYVGLLTLIITFVAIFH
jgi:hypothetical protein